MTALDFPTGPSNGDIYDEYIYNSAKGAWLRIKDPVPAEKFFIGENAPTGPTAGQFWLDSSDGIAYAYYDDGSSAQWVQFGVGREGPTGPTGATGATGPTGEFDLYSFNAQTGTTYTLALSDKGGVVEITNASPISLVVPTNAVVPFSIGTSITVVQNADGQITIGGSGITFRATPGLKTRTKWSSASLIKRDTNTWYVFGDLVP